MDLQWMTVMQGALCVGCTLHDVCHDHWHIVVVVVVIEQLSETVAVDTVSKAERRSLSQAL